MGVPHVHLVAAGLGGRRAAHVYVVAAAGPDGEYSRVGPAAGGGRGDAGVTEQIERVGARREEAGAATAVKGDRGRGRAGARSHVGAAGDVWGGDDYGVRTSIVVAQVMQRITCTMTACALRCDNASRVGAVHPPQTDLCYKVGACQRRGEGKGPAGDCSGPVVSRGRGVH